MTPGETTLAAAVLRTRLADAARDVLARATLGGSLTDHAADQLGADWGSADLTVDALLELADFHDQLHGRRPCHA